MISVRLLVFMKQVMSPLIIIFQIFVHLCPIRAEEYNLYGDAGQAYSMEAYLGHPHQKLKLLVDTGSTTLAIASYAHESNNEYFHTENSSSIHDTGKRVQAKYSQGNWSGWLVSDLIQFPSLLTIPEVRTDIAVITESHKFFINGSKWQGLLGLAYLPVGAWGDGVTVESWLNAVDQTMGKPMSFGLKLCGPISSSNTTHYGHFEMLDDNTPNGNSNTLFRTPILRKRWFEVGVITVRVINNNSTDDITNDTIRDPNVDMCQKLNAEKSIVDSGTTNIRLPDALYKQIVDELKDVYRSLQIPITDQFWYQVEGACWPEPQGWTWPWLAIDLLSYEADDQYFTIEIPPQNYMRAVGVYNSMHTEGTMSEYCYKLGLEPGGTETVLGYTAMEGLQVLFNKSAGWIGWQTSDCGPKARITGPHNASTSLKQTCQLLKPVSEVPISIKAAQWSLCAVSIIAAGVLVYLLAPCVKTFVVRKWTASHQISVSHAALVEREVS